MRKAFYLEKDLNKNADDDSMTWRFRPCVHDVLGGLAGVAHASPRAGKTAQIPISDGKKFVQVKVDSQRREELQDADGARRRRSATKCFVFDNVLYKRSGHLHIWLTDDAERLPVQLQVRLQFTIGTITLKLEKEEKL